ncbi:toll-like receptor 3 [Scleropages formosus]|nr:toll-like receptor 3 [Scleropages formosus]XP_018591143.2 toll-like receptor 3 [Scleropages formosus]
MARSLRPLHLLLVLLLCVLGCSHAGPGKAVCRVVRLTADCSHLSLEEVPADLPANITALDVSHNRLRKLPPVVLGRYPQLQLLQAGYNSIQALEADLCRMLPLLRKLRVQHNVIHLLKEANLVHCSGLTELNLASNRLKLLGDPFLPLKSLVSLDVSANGLSSARLGTQPQMGGLRELSLSGNKMSTLQKDDFSCLCNSSVQVLRLGSLPLKNLEPGCLKPLEGLRELVLDGTKLGPNLTDQLCQELKGSAIDRLSLRDVHLTSVLHTTFMGLADTNITAVDLSRNEMSSMANGSLRWLRTLKLLSMEENNFRQLTREMFVGLDSLRSLVLRNALAKSRSWYAVIEDYAFSPLRCLESLFLDRTTFRGLTAQTFSGLVSLQYLNLSWSKFDLKIVTNESFASLSNSPLRTLNLTETGITRLADGAFASLGNLSTLLLGYNFISQNLSGSEFRGLSRIQKIHLSFNNQKIRLTSWSFQHVPTLRTLMLRRALTGTLDLKPSPFQPLQELSVLDLSNNNIANINSDLLSGLHNLRVLYLQHNNLARIWKSANPGGPLLFLRGLENLTVLELDYNGFDEIPAAGLQGLRKLQELSLGGNMLDFLREGIFSDMVSLRSLNLQKNLITSVQKSVFQPALANLSVLHMERNPFDCTCDSILWFAEWLNGTDASVPQRDSYVCNTPSAYFNKTISQFEPLSCRDTTPFQALYVFTSTTVLIVMATALVFHFQGWRIQFYWSVLVSRTLGFREVDRGEERFQYDAYVIHAQKDRRWVERHLLSLEDKQLRFCLEDRDFVPGRTRLECIVDMMRQSRKIVFVVTETLLNDPWCTQYKAHHAIQQVIEESRDSVVLVFLEDVPDHRLVRALLLRRGMLRSRCLLNWPPQRERRPAFQQSLWVALGSSNRIQ